MTAAELLTMLTAAGCRLIPEGEQLRVQDPQHALTDELRQAIRQHKQELLTLVELFEERAAIIEYDGRIPCAEAERLAWECLQARGVDHAVALHE